MSRGDERPTGAGEHVEDRIRRVYGTARFPASGVLHPTAVWESPSGSHRTIRIEPGGPGSETDRFVLDLARARADAIVTTGKILRDEPGLTHAFTSDSGAGLERWRREVLGRTVGPPPTVVLTSGRDLPLDHLLFEDPAVVFTSPEGGRALRARREDLPFRVVESESPGIREVLAWLRKQEHDVVSVETGARTSNTLYEPPLAVDELLLSVFRGELAERLRGTELEPRPRDAFEEPAPPHEVLEPSGPWTFHRFVRRRM